MKVLSLDPGSGTFMSEHPDDELARPDRQLRTAVERDEGTAGIFEELIPDLQDRTAITREAACLKISGGR